MKNNIFSALLVFISYTLFAQERILIPGRLLYKSTDIVAANVINNTAQIATITDASGEFKIEMKEGDEIIFSALTIRIKVFKVTPEIMSIKRLEINVEENINALDEVIVTPENVDKFIDLKDVEDGFPKHSLVESGTGRAEIILKGLALENLSLIENYFPHLKASVPWFPLI